MGADGWRAGDFRRRHWPGSDAVPRGISQTAENLEAVARVLHNLLWNKYYVDEIYDVLLVRPLRRIAGLLWKGVDNIDRWRPDQDRPFFVDIFGAVAQRFQNGDVQRYIIAVMVGAAGILFGSTYWLAYQGIQGQVKVDKRQVTLKLGDERMRPGQLIYAIDWDGDGKFETPMSASTAKSSTSTEAPVSTRSSSKLVTPDVWNMVKRSDDWFFGASVPLVAKG